MNVYILGSVCQCERVESLIPFFHSYPTLAMDGSNYFGSSVELTLDICTRKVIDNESY